MNAKQPACILLALALTGCSSEVTFDDLAGGWTGRTLKQDFEFGYDGQTLMRDHKHGLYKGQCTVSGGNQLTCNFERFSRPVVREIRLPGDELIMTDPNGHDEIYVRK
ncbi:hypothetical protein [Solemya velesiana gill symbiont]|uniref:Uncharacterized protein n=1 Tax=Solemya velesiana gill symbiont TaxID=1918948 RepID=A0A1T2KYD3_9GAMM|nr:hypothetical protein [Solemya velesiana gill symbiont]OOZ37842.1 hypothetical protein BOW51_00070 [Solemya velesiana gill symbiont]